MPPPEEPPPYGHFDLHGLFRPIEDDSRRLCLGDADEGRWLGFAKALAQMLDPHAWIHHDRDRPDFEHRKGQREEVQTGLHHEHGSNAGVDSNSHEGVGDAIGAAMQLERRQLRVAGRPVRVTPVRDRHRKSVRLALGHIGQEGSDVGVVWGALHGRVGPDRRLGFRCRIGPSPVHADLSVGRAAEWTNSRTSGMISSPASSRT